MNMEDRSFRIALNAIPFMGPVTFHRLVAAFGSARNVFSAGIESLKEVEGVSDGLARKIAETDPQKIAQREFDLAEKLGASIVTVGDAGYPAPLSNAYSPPPVLSIKGEWKESDQLSIAVVGTRSPTQYGRSQAEKLSTELAKLGITIVSGLARGVDGVAHRAALSAGGRTVAVLGCGLNVYYPAEHRDLQKRIPDSGCVISQFPMATGPDKVYFPMRNRIVSGLTLGTLVIEAPEKSGALITVYAAIDDNREAFAVPGPINSPKSVGTNNLIKRGHAKLVQRVEDIIEDLPDYAKQWVVDRQGILPLAPAVTLSAEEEIVMEALTADVRHIDVITQACGLPPNMVSAILLTLELKGVARQAPGKMFHIP